MKLLKKYWPGLTFSGLLALPSVVLAQEDSLGWIDELFRIQNLSEAIRNIINILLIIAGVVAVIYLIYGGYQYVTAGGNAEQAAAARTTIFNAIIGLVVIFAAYAVINFVVYHYLGAGRPT